MIALEQLETGCKARLHAPEQRQAIMILDLMVFLELHSAQPRWRLSQGLNAAASRCSSAVSRPVRMTSSRGRNIS
jgi:hypothetical protein